MCLLFALGLGGGGSLLPLSQDFCSQIYCLALPKFSPCIPHSLLSTSRSACPLHLCFCKINHSSHFWNPSCVPNTLPALSHFILKTNQ